MVTMMMMMVMSLELKVSGVLVDGTW